MNAWYIAAILLGPLAAFCAYRGTNQDSQRGQQAIESRLETIGNRLNQLSESSANNLSSDELDKIKSEYLSTAEEFFASLPDRVRNEQSEEAKNRARELSESAKFQELARDLVAESSVIAAAYNHAAGQQVVSVSNSLFPVNMFQNRADWRLLAKFESGRAWLVHLVFYSDSTPAIQFVRVESSDDQDASNLTNFHLTNDSINFLDVNDVFSISRNSNISPKIASLTQNLGATSWPSPGVSGALVNLFSKIVEFELLQARLSTER